MNTTEYKWIAERDGEEFARYRTLSDAKKELSELGGLRFSSRGSYEVGGGDVWINRVD